MEELGTSPPILQKKHIEKVKKQMILSIISQVIRLGHSRSGNLYDI